MNEHNPVVYPEAGGVKRGTHTVTVAKHAPVMWTEVIAKGG